MEFLIGGGVREHGRNCFCVTSAVTYIVDCGIMRGSKNPYPKLPKEKIAAARYLFLTHPHEDHIGAFAFLLANGFRGTVVAAPETLAALPAYPYTLALPAGGGVIELNGVFLCYGRSGHCAGGLWYHVASAGESVLFSGDYCENSCFAVDTIRDRCADIAVLDCAFGAPVYEREEQEKRILSYAAAAGEKGILLPVPVNGRSVDLACLFRRFGFRVFADEKLRRFFSVTAEGGYWLTERAAGEVKGFLSEKEADGGKRAVLFADAQLSSAEGRRAADEAVKSGGSVLFTGHADKGSGAEKFLSSGKGSLLLYNAHTDKAGADSLARANEFGKVVYFHNADIS